MARARPAPRGLILDSGAVIGLSRGDERIRAQLREAVDGGIPVSVPVVVLAETLRGGPRDAAVHRILKAVGTSPTTPAIGRMAGTLLGRSGGANTPDALVAAEAAAATPSVLLTSDPDDLGILLAGEDGVEVVRV